MSMPREDRDTLVWIVATIKVQAAELEMAYNFTESRIASLSPSKVRSDKRLYQVHPTLRSELNRLIELRSLYPAALEIQLTLCEHIVAILEHRHDDPVGYEVNAPRLRVRLSPDAVLAEQEALGDLDVFENDVMKKSDAYTRAYRILNPDWNSYYRPRV